MQTIDNEVDPLTCEVVAAGDVITHSLHQSVPDVRIARLVNQRPSLARQINLIGSAVMPRRLLLG